MKWILFVVLIASAAIAQSRHKNSQTQTTEQGDVDAPSSVLRREGSDVLSREQARSKQDLCFNFNVGEKGRAGFGQCLNKKFKTTEQDYLAYLRAIGALL
jgi:hypothetical protein